MAETVTFTKAAGEKIAKTVRQVLGSPSDNVGTATRQNQTYTRIFWGQLSVDDDGVSTDFTETSPTYPMGVLTWTDTPGGRTGIVANGPIEGADDGIVVLIRQDFDVTDPTNPIAIYQAIEQPIAAGLYCQKDDDTPGCTVEELTEYPVGVNITNFLFQVEDFDLNEKTDDGETSCDTKTMLIEAKPINLRQKQYAGDGPDSDFCDIKNLVFDAFTTESADAAEPDNIIDKTPDASNAPDNYYSYPVYFDIQSITDDNDLGGDRTLCPCAIDDSHNSTYKRPSVYVAGHIYTNVCDYLPDATDCNGNNFPSINTFTFGDGLTVTNTGDCSSVTSEVQVDVSIQIDDSSTDYMFATAESDDDGCYWNIGICTQNIDVVTAITCEDGTLQYTTTTVTVLTTCDDEEVKRKTVAKVRVK
jgi:hypothetical protein